MKPLAIINCDYSDRPLPTMRYLLDKRKVVRVIDACDIGVFTGKPRDAVDLLLLDHHDPTGERCHILRTEAISLKTPEDATPQLLAAFDDDIHQAVLDFKKTNNIQQLLAIIHGDTRTRHVHLAHGNSDGNRSLDWGPEFLSKLNDFQWTDALASGKGHGQRKGLDVYPKAKKLVVKDVAHDLAHVIKPGDNLAALVERHPDFSDFRRRKDGSLISFAYGQQRIRVSTLHSFMVELLGDLTPPLAAPPAPILPVPTPTLSSPEPDATEALTRFRQRPRVQSKRKNKSPGLEPGLS